MYFINDQKANNKSRVANSIAGALALCLGMSLTATQASAEITQDCILEGTVDMRTAEQLGQSVYVKFRSAKRGSEAGCDMARRSGKSRRVQFISSPDTSMVRDADHGSTVRYRYIERDNQQGSWELMPVNDARSSF